VIRERIDVDAWGKWCTEPDILAPLEGLAADIAWRWANGL